MLPPLILFIICLGKIIGQLLQNEGKACKRSIKQSTPGHRGTGKQSVKIMMTPANTFRSGVNLRWLSKKSFKENTPTKNHNNTTALKARHEN